MSLAKHLSHGIQKKKIRVEEVRENPNNFYEVKEEDIKKIMRSIVEDGQMENVVVYEDDSYSDGKKYTLLSGSTRYQALVRINEEGLTNEHCDGMLKADIYERPKSSYAEQRMIRDANLQREKTTADMYNEILSCEKEIEYLRLQNPEQLAGRKTRDVVGDMLGISGRTVDNRKNAYLKLSESSDSGKKEKKKTLSEEEIIKVFKRTERKYEKLLREWEQIHPGTVDDSLGANIKKMLELIYNIMNEYE